MRIGLAIAAALGGAAQAWAGPLVITPTTVAIPPGRHSAVVEVENAGDDPVDLQFRAYDWRQEDGDDRLSPTDALVVSPAIATVAPHARQVFRVLQMGGSGTGERSYRLRLNQLPRADGTAVAINLEFSLPVFQGPADAAPRLSWASEPGGVRVTNEGNARIRFAALAVTTADGATMALPGAASAYLLSGASRRFALARPVAAVRLIGRGDRGAIDIGAANAPATPPPAR